jgi:glucose/mannose-6-phosphate isomerase
MLQANGLLSVPSWDIEESLSMLEEKRGRVREHAERLAEWLVGVKCLAVVAPEPLYPAAVRFRSELAENAKMVSTASMLPEAGHNELEAWAIGAGLDLLVLDPGVEPWSTLLREAVRIARVAGVHTVASEGETLLQKLVWFTWLAGVASVRAAMLRGVDPYRLTGVKEFRRVVEEATGWGEGEAAPRL